MSNKNTDKPSVGIIANPYSSRDIRRLISSASSIQTVERANIVERILVTLSNFGIHDAYMMPDKSSLSSHLIRNMKTRTKLKKHIDVNLNFLDMDITSTVEDTFVACRLLKEQGVGAIIILGGDGTHRAVSTEITDIPLVSISTGTNNAFPRFYEATLAGMALGIYLGKHVPADQIVRKNKMIHVDVNGTHKDIALVDLAITNDRWIGARAVWKLEQLQELYLSFCEPASIGMSSIGGLLEPVSRLDEHGLRIIIDPEGNTETNINAPIAPGLFEEIGIAEYSRLTPGEPCKIHSKEGVLALDGEREIEFSQNDEVSVYLEHDGPLTIDVEKALDVAAKNNVFVNQKKSFEYVSCVNE